MKHAWPIRPTFEMQGLPCEVCGREEGTEYSGNDTWCCPECLYFIDFDTPESQADRAFEQRGER